MKKLAMVLALVCMAVCIVGCSSTAIKPQEENSEGTPKTTIAANAPQGDSKTTTTTAAPKKLTASELTAAIEQQEVKVTSTKYVVQDEDYKTLYPDLLQAVIANGSTADIKNAVVAFAAWDENNLPIKIKGNMDFSDGAYVKKCNFNDVNLVPGKSYGENSGMAVDEDIIPIKKFKAIVVSYETFDGDTWENPLFEDWCEIYEGKRYSE